MPDIASRKFVETFQRAFSTSGRLSVADLESLQSARAGLSNATDQAAADSVLAMLKHDHELDAFEVAKLGTPKMDSLLRDWFQTYRQKTVSTGQFVTFAKAKTGVDFGDFFKAWNSLTAVPSFDADVKLAGSKVKVSLTA
jgi:hypothetical protein